MSRRWRLRWHCAACGVSGSALATGDMTLTQQRLRLRQSHTTHSLICQRDNGLTAVAYQLCQVDVTHARGADGL